MDQSQQQPYREVTVFLPYGASLQCVVSALLQILVLLPYSVL